MKPDFRYAAYPPALAMARLCAVQGRMGDAQEWFHITRQKLAETESRMHRPICDYDEALALVRAKSADRERISLLLDDAERAMTEIGMPGWLRRVTDLRTLSAS